MPDIDLPLQESAAKKAAWKTAAEQRFPIGTVVRVAWSDVTLYLGEIGTVIGYDLGLDGEWPLVRVQFTTPLDGGTITGDAFYGDGLYDDEIVKYFGRCTNCTRLLDSEHECRGGCSQL